jgi:hypothetical protein
MLNAKVKKKEKSSSSPLIFISLSLFLSLFISLSFFPSFLPSFSPFCSLLGPPFRSVCSHQIEVPSDDNYSDDELTFLPYYTYLTNCFNATQRAYATASIIRTWKSISNLRSDLWNAIFAATSSLAPINKKKKKKEKEKGKRKRKEIEKKGGNSLKCFFLIACSFFSLFFFFSFLFLLLRSGRRGHDASRH